MSHLSSKLFHNLLDALAHNYYVDILGYKPVDPQIVRDRMNILEERYQELRELAADRKRRLDDNKRLCQFWWDIADLENNLKEQEQVLALTDTGRDIFSVNHLLAKHKNAENNLDSAKRNLESLEKQGNGLVQERIPGSEDIPASIANIKQYFDKLKQLADVRRKNLEGGVEYYQVKIGSCNIMILITMLRALLSTRS